MHGVAMGKSLAGQRPAHQVPGSQVQLPELVVTERRRRHPRVDAVHPERLALVDVADARADPLVEQQLTERRRLRQPSSPHDFFRVEPLRQDVWAQVFNGPAAVAHHLYDRRREEDGDRIIETEHRPRAALRLPPTLTGSVEMPGAGHPHVGVQGDLAVEPHDEVLSDRLDREQAVAFEPLDDIGCRLCNGLSKQPPA